MTNYWKCVTPEAWNGGGTAAPAAAQLLNQKLGVKPPERWFFELLCASALPSQVGLEQGTCSSSSEGCDCPKHGSSFLTPMPAVKKAQSSSHLKACMWQVWIISQKKPKLISNQLESSYSTILWVCCSDPIINCLINPQGHRTKSEQPGHLHEAHTCPEGAGYLNQSIVSADLK